MNHWPFIITAYSITALGTISVSLWAFLAMRKAEAAAADVGREA
jgi:hypothetical protein